MKGKWCLNLGLYSELGFVLFPLHWNVSYNLICKKKNQIVEF